MQHLEDPMLQFLPQRNPPTNSPVSNLPCPCGQMFSTPQSFIEHAKNCSLFVSTASNFAEAARTLSEFPKRASTPNKDPLDLRTQFFQCSECSQGPFPSHSMLFEHFATRHNEKGSFKCHKCAENFTFLHHFLQHKFGKCNAVQDFMKTAAQSSMNCSLCHQSFQHPSELFNHFQQCKYISEMEQRTHPLETLEKRLLSTKDIFNSSKKSHESSHSDSNIVSDVNRPFKCDHCVKSFKSKALLDQHMHIHFPPKYTCRYCSKKYRWPPVFYHHQRTCKKRTVFANQSQINQETSHGPRLNNFDYTVGANNNHIRSVLIPGAKQVPSRPPLYQKHPPFKLPAPQQPSFDAGFINPNLFQMMNAMGLRLPFLASSQVSQQDNPLEELQAKLTNTRNCNACGIKYQGDLNSYMSHMITCQAMKSKVEPNNLANIINTLFPAQNLQMNLNEADRQSTCSIHERSPSPAGTSNKSSSKGNDSGSSDPPEINSPPPSTQIQQQSNIQNAFGELLASMRNGSSSNLLFEMATNMLKASGKVSEMTHQNDSSYSSPPESPSTLSTTTCKHCGKEFSSRLALKQHVEGKHGTERRYKCPGCTKSYRWGASYYYHRKSCPAMKELKAPEVEQTKLEQPVQTRSSSGTPDDEEEEFGEYSEDEFEAKRARRGSILTSSAIDSSSAFEDSKFLQSQNGSNQRNPISALGDMLIQ